MVKDKTKEKIKNKTEDRTKDKTRNKIKKRVCLLAAGVLCMLTACDSSQSKKIEVKPALTGDEASEVESELTGNESSEVESELTGDEASKPDKDTSTFAEPSETGKQQKRTDKESKVETTKTEAQVGKIVVYVCGAVKNPGVYTLEGKARMTDAVQAAGGMKKDADLDVINLAQYVSDGQMIRIPTEGEENVSLSGQGHSGDLTGQSPGGLSTTEAEAGDTAVEKVDINTATAAELMEVPGIGQTRADAILQYREEHGGFEKIEEIMQVSGIKEGSFARMEPYICVK